MLPEHVEDTSTLESSNDLHAQPSVESAEMLSDVPSREKIVAEISQPLTSSLVNNLMEMGFTRPQISVALERYVI